MQIGLAGLPPPFKPAGWECTPFIPLLLTLALGAAEPVGALAIARGVEVKTEGNSMIGRPNCSNSRWKPAALISVIRSLLPLYGVKREPYPVS